MFWSFEALTQNQLSALADVYFFPPVVYIAHLFLSAVVSFQIALANLRPCWVNIP